MRHLRSIAAVLLVSLSSVPAAADTDRGWTLRLHGAAIRSSAEHTSFVPGHGTFTGESGTGFGVVIGAEYRFNRVVGLEPSLLLSGIDADFRLDDGDATYTDSDRLTMNSLSLAVNLHVTPRGRVDFYFAVGLNFIEFGDMYATFPATGLHAPLSTGWDVAPGIGVGLDVPFGEGGWSFSAALRYMKAESREEDNPFWRQPILVDVDPVILQLGVAYRF